jgi:formate hydrogenlyase subunit 4
MMTNTDYTWWPIALMNLLLVLLLSPLLEGMIRKLKATIHSRKGPPIIQPYLDLLKLLGKEELRSTQSLYFRMAPIAALAAILVAALLVPMGGGSPLGFGGDAIAFLYFFALSSVAIMIGGFATGSPYAAIGGSREMMMLLTVEPVLAIALITAAVKAKTLELGQMSIGIHDTGFAISLMVAVVAAFLALQAQLGKLPFDIPEADQEIMEGPFVESSGPSFALFRLSFFARQLVLGSLLVQVFVPWPQFGVLYLDVVFNLIKVFVAIVLVGVIDAVVPRLRIDQSMNYFKYVIAVALIALGFALIGH